MDTKFSVDETCKHLWVEDDGVATAYFEDLQAKAEEIINSLKVPDEWIGKLSSEQLQIEQDYIKGLRENANLEASQVETVAEQGRRILRENPELVSEMFKEFFQQKQQQPVKPAQTENINATNFYKEDIGRKSRLPSGISSYRKP